MHTLTSLSRTGPFSFERLCDFFHLSLLLLFVLLCLAALSALVRLPFLDLWRRLSALSWLLLSELRSEPDDEALLCLGAVRLFKVGSSRELLLRLHLRVSLLGLHHATEDDSVRGCLRGICMMQVLNSHGTCIVLVSKFWGTATLRSGRKCALPSPLPLTWLISPMRGPGASYRGSTCMHMHLKLGTI